MDRFRKAMLQTVVADLISPEDFSAGRFNDEIDEFLTKMEFEALKDVYKTKLTVALQLKKKSTIAKLKYKQAEYENLSFVMNKQGVDVESVESGSDSDEFCTDSEFNT